MSGHNLCGSWSLVNRIVQNMIGRSKKDGAPFLRQSLPVQIVGRSCPRLSGWNACTVLVNDHRSNGLNTVWNPEGVYNTKLQLPFGCGRRGRDLETSTSTARRSKRSPPNLVWTHLNPRSRLMALSLSSALGNFVHSLLSSSGTCASALPHLGYVRWRAAICLRISLP